MLDKEIEHRIANGLKIKTDMARFSMLATIENFDFDQPSANRAQFTELSHCHWIEAKQNILFYSETGRGKTHLARQTIKHGHTTLFISTNDLFDQLAQVNNEGRLKERPIIFNRNKLLIIDELGYPLSKIENRAAIFYTLIAKHYGKVFNDPLTGRSEDFHPLAVRPAWRTLQKRS